MQATDMNATEIVVPEEVVAKLGQGKKPKLFVSLKGCSYRSTIHVMGGTSLLPLAKDHREKAGVKGGDKVEVTLEVDAAPREVEVSKDLVAALKKAGATAGFAALSFTHRKEHVRAIGEAKAPERRGGSRRRSRWRLRGRRNLTVRIRTDRAGGSGIRVLRG
jgi:hypothetical protein